MNEQGDVSGDEQSINYLRRILGVDRAAKLEMSKLG
jgi:hypothetical protein